MRTLIARMSAPAAGALGGVLAAVMLMGLTAQAGAQVMASDETAGYVVFPKIIVEESGPGLVGVDTLIQLTNTNTENPVRVNCWYVNANGHCGDQNGPICESSAECSPGLECIPGWVPGDFFLVLTREQPLAWSARDGLAGTDVPCSPPSNTSCPDASDGAVPPLPTRFRGELKCVEVDIGSEAPVVANDIKGEATIIRVQDPVMTPPRMTAAAYNASGFQAVEPGTDPAGPLCLGSLPTMPVGAPAGTCAATYAPCPNVLIVDHFFDGAEVPNAGVVNTDLTLVPCSERLDTAYPDFNQAAPPAITAQMLVFNEFEQRFSTWTRVQCFKETTLSDIDTRPGPADDIYSIFAAGVQGTASGQTRIRGVTGPPGPTGYGLIGVAQEFYRAAPGDPVDASTAFNLHADGFTPGGDAVYRADTIMPAP
jgi:hypothetical protein